MGGFSLISLMVTIAIIAILLAVASSNLKSIGVDSRLAAASNGFVGNLNYARGEAAKRGVRVTLCKSADGATCTLAGNWSQGAIVFVDDTVPFGSKSGGETLIRTIPAVAKDTISGSGSSANYVSYLPNGIPKDAANAWVSDTFTVCDFGSASFSGEGREIALSASGRTRIDRKSGICP